MDLDTYQVQIELGLNAAAAKAGIQQVGELLDDSAKRLEKSLAKSINQIESYTADVSSNLKRSSSNALSLDQAFLNASKSIGVAGKKVGSLNDLEAEVAAGLGKQARTMRDINKSHDEIVSKTEQEAKNYTKSGESIESQIKPIKEAMDANGEIHQTSEKQVETLKKQNIIMSAANNALVRTKELWGEMKRDMALVFDYYIQMTRANDKFYTSNNRVYGTQVDMIRATRDLSMETGMLREEAIAAFEALVEVRTPVSDMKELAGAIGQVERITGITAKSLANWTRQLRSAGFHADKQIKSLEYLAAAQRALSIDTKSLERAMTGATLTASELVTFFGKDAPEQFLIARTALEGIATAAGMDEKAVTELYQTLEKTGVEAAIFWSRFGLDGNASVEKKFNALMMNADKALKGLGLSLEQIAKGGNTIEKGVLDKVSKSLGISLDTLRQLAQAKQTLIDQGQTDLLDFGLTQQKVEEEQKKMKALAEMFGEANSTLPRSIAQFQAMWRNQGRGFEQLFQILGIKFFKTITKFVQGLDINSLFEEVTKAFASGDLTDLMDAIATRIRFVFRNVTDILANALTTFTNFFKKLSATWKNPKFTSIFSTFITEAKASWKILSPLLADFYNEFSMWVGKLWNGANGQAGVKQWLFDMWNGFQGWFEEVVYPKIVIAVNWFKTFFQDVLAGRTSNIAKGPIFNALLKATNWVVDSLLGLLGSAVDTIWDSIGQKIANGVAMRFDLLLSMLKEKMLIALEYAKVMFNPLAYLGVGGVDDAVQKIRDQRRKDDYETRKMYGGDTSKYADVQAKDDQAQFNADANRMSQLAKQIEILQAQNIAGDRVNQLLKQQEIVRLEMELHEAQRRHRGDINLLEYEKAMTKKIEKAKADAMNPMVKTEERADELNKNDGQLALTETLAGLELKLGNALLANSEQLVASVDQSRAIEARLQGSFDPLTANLRGIEEILGSELTKASELLANPPVRTQTIATVQVTDKREGVKEDDRQSRVSEAQLATQREQLKVLSDMVSDDTTRQAILTIANLVQVYLPDVGRPESGFDSNLTKWG